MNELINQLKEKAEKQVDSAYLGLRQTYEDYPEARPIIDIFLKWYFSNKATIICGLNGHAFPDFQKKGKYFLRGDEYMEPLQFMDRLAGFVSHDLFDDGAYRIEWWEVVYEIKERKIGEKTVKLNYPVYHTDTGRFQVTYPRINSRACRTLKSNHLEIKDLSTIGRVTTACP